MGIDSGYIAGIFVSNEMQSIGIGKLLLEKCKQVYDNLSLSVYKKTTGQLSFMQKKASPSKKNKSMETLAK